MRRSALILLAALLAIAGGALFFGQRAREQREQDAARRSATMRVELLALRSALRIYRTRFGSPPAKLEDLVAAGLISHIPVDPITHSAKTWKTETEQIVRVDDFRATATQPVSGIVDVRSGAPGKDERGKRWADY